VGRLRHFGAQQYNTATDGALSFEFRDDGIVAQKERTKIRRYWM
jgi:beta-lactamase superfamily II metal-dependent hydrolase